MNANERDIGIPAIIVVGMILCVVLMTGILRQHQKVVARDEYFNALGVEARHCQSTLQTLRAEFAAGQSIAGQCQFTLLPGVKDWPLLLDPALIPLTHDVEER